MERLQPLLGAVIAALITAVAAIVVALINAGGGNGGNGGNDEDESIAISSVTFMTAAPPLLVRITGTATGLRATDDIHVVARPVTSDAGAAAADAAEAAAAVNQWIASQAAKESGDGSWEVDLGLPAEVSPPLMFVAVIYPGAATSGAGAEDEAGGDGDASRSPTPSPDPGTDTDTDHEGAGSEPLPGDRVADKLERLGPEGFTNSAEVVAGVAGP